MFMNRSLPLFFAVVLSLPVFAADAYKGPYALTVSKDGTKIYIANHDAGELAVLNTADNKIGQTLPLGKKPNGLILSADGKTLYITAGGSGGSVISVDIAANKAVKEVPAGHTPTGGAATPDGKTLFVCNRFNGTVAQYELPDLKFVKNIKAVREPRGAVCTPDGKTVYVMNGMPNDIGNIPEDQDAMIDVAAEMTAVNVADGSTKNIRLPNGSGSQHGLCISPDGKYVYVTKILARFQMPTTQLERGWINTNGISIIDTAKLNEENGGFVNTVLLDDVDLGAANPWGITVSADGKQLFVAASGSNELIIVDTEPMHKKLDALPEENPNGTGYAGGSSATATRADVPNDLAFLVGMKKRVRLNGVGPRGVAFANNNVYLGMYFSDTVEKVNLNS
ncbi:MAG: YncE family protein, partial [Planctomycetaceae bacterium]|nr:YncE family protein [Planctomycetaceae bacterium]